MQTLSKETTMEQLTQEISSGKTMLFFTAGWCPDCRFIKPFMPEIEEEFKDYKFIEVDRDDNMDLAIEFNIFGIPSFIAFENGKEIGRYVNKDRKTKAQVEDFINNL
ncbi:thioredoxin family protein [Lentilactobacillus laojiaonis]|uniref:thioredoxin family protein n=1 Tax=Lentilactobacillus laojiaonis TaxID=2883998 RepID=UPI001D0BC488|nr:thioredoxin family protein [Lentilactobacillus laojiaonis]UDM32577.1 thioredoxin family protein [Lentilactobacillus laojiaonis]